MKNFDDSTRIDARVKRLNAASKRTASKRTGLAPVEMVLVLPILMLIMSVIIVFGYASSWKLRTETVSRDVAWRARYPRFSNRDARAVEWAAPATMSNTSDANLRDLGNEPVLVDPIIAGPLFSIDVDPDVLDFTRGINKGVAHVDRPPPIFANLTSLDFQVEHPILSDSFHHRQMGISNVARRIPLIYDVGLDMISDSQAIGNAVAALLNSPHNASLRVIDADEELIANEWYRNFYPRIRIRDRDKTWGPLKLDIILAVDRDILSVKRLPRSMGNHWKRMYEEQLVEAELESEKIRLKKLIGLLAKWIRGLKD